MPRAWALVILLLNTSTIGSWALSRASRNVRRPRPARFMVSAVKVCISRASTRIRSRAACWGKGWPSGPPKLPSPSAATMYRKRMKRGLVGGWYISDTSSVRSPARSRSWLGPWASSASARKRPLAIGHSWLRPPSSTVRRSPLAPSTRP
jgi:hypothetical protein